MATATHERGPFVRPYRGSDLEAVYDVCVRTGDKGNDATGKFAQPRLLPDIFAGPYLHFEPGLAFVVEDGDRAVGYVLGTANTTAFVRAYREKWLPLVAPRYPGPPPAPSTPDEHFLAFFHSPEQMLMPELDDYPAHLHIDILPSHQGRGYGRRLVESFLGAAALAGAPRAHLTVSAANTRATGFYLKLGFEHLPVDVSGVVLLGRTTAL
jgi:ribosomal protein S18 acetylase RimI-like enzyme